MSSVGAIISHAASGVAGAIKSFDKALTEAGNKIAEAAGIDVHHSTAELSQSQLSGLHSPSDYIKQDFLNFQEASFAQEEAKRQLLKDLAAAA